MNKPLLALLATALVSGAAAAELRLYSSFAEVRELKAIQGGVLETRFGLDALSQIVPGTLTLEGVRTLSQTQTAEQPKSWLESFEGKTVVLRDGEQRLEVRLIRASDLTVQEIKTGRYRVGVPLSLLEFPTLPPVQAQGQTLVRFTVQGTGTPVLTYLTRALSWSPRYTLNVARDGSARMESLADIRNGTSSAVKVDSSELIAGEVNLAYGGQPVPMPAPLARANLQADTAFESAPNIGQGVEGAGVYAYPLNRAFELPANSVYSLPFLEPKLTVERVARLETYFNPGFAKGKLSRMYRIKSDVLLPGGNVTVRDENRLVGQVRVSDVAAGEDTNLFLGQDPDVGFTRAVKTLSQTKTGASYQVTLTLTNAKKREVAFEVLERFDGKVEVSGTVERVNEGLRIKGTLPAGGKFERSYTLKFTYPQP